MSGMCAFCSKPHERTKSRGEYFKYCSSDCDKEALSLRTKTNKPRHRKTTAERSIYSWFCSKCEESRKWGNGSIENTNAVFLWCVKCDKDTIHKQRLERATAHAEKEKP
jgi:hypothetical protein